MSSGRGTPGPKLGMRKNKRGEITPKLDKARAIVRDLLEANEPINSQRLQEKHGISHVTFDTAIAAEIARRDALKEQGVSVLSATAQRRLELAIRQHRRNLDIEFENRKQEWLKEALEDTVLPAYGREMDEARQVIESRKGVMSEKTFRQIVSCLHPDRVAPELKATYTAAYIAFNDLKLVLLSEKEMPTTAPKMPRSYQEWEEAKAAATARRKRQRGHNDIRTKA